MSDTDYEDDTDDDSGSSNDDTTGAIPTSDETPDTSDDSQQNQDVISEAVPTSEDQDTSDQEQLPEGSTPTIGADPNVGKDENKVFKPFIKLGTDHDITWKGFGNWLLNGWDNHMDQPAGKIAEAHANAPDNYTVSSARGRATLGAVPGGAPSAAEAQQPENPTVKAPTVPPPVSPRGGQVGARPVAQFTPNTVSPADVEGAQPQSPDMPPTREMIQQGFLTPDQRAAIDKADPSTVMPGDPSYGLPGRNNWRAPGNPGQVQTQQVKVDPQAKSQLDQLIKAGYPPSQIANQWPEIARGAGVEARWDPVGRRSVFQPITQQVKFAPSEAPAPQYYGAPQPNAPRLPNNPVAPQAAQPAPPAQTGPAPAPQAPQPPTLRGGGGSLAPQQPQQQPVKIVRGGRVSYANPNTGQESASPPGQLDAQAERELAALPRGKNGQVSQSSVQDIIKSYRQRQGGGTTDQEKGQTAAQRQTALQKMDDDARAKFLATNPNFAKGTTFEILKKAAQTPVGPALPGQLWDPERGVWVKRPQQGTPAQ